MNSYSSWEEKRAWAKTLKVGDFVNSCQNKNLQIVELHKKYSWPQWVHKVAEIHPIFFTYELPDWLDWLDWLTWKWLLFVYYCASYFASRTVYMDSDLVLNDGSRCSAMLCCDEPIQVTILVSDEVGRDSFLEWLCINANERFQIFGALVPSDASIRLGERILMVKERKE